MTSRLANRAATGVLAAAAALGAGLAQAVGVSGQGTWETTLLPRDLDGNAGNGPEAFYDTALNITWLRNANANGAMYWNDAMTWANTLVVGGVGGWRLPKVVDTGAPGCDHSFGGGTDCGYNVDTATGEMAHLHHVTLGNLSYCPPGTATCSEGPQPGWGLTNTGGLQNLDFNGYWSGTEHDPLNAWFFNTQWGQQRVGGMPANLFLAMAVRPGDVVTAVPEPQTYALMLMGFGALMLAVRRRTR